MIFFRKTRATREIKRKARRGLNTKFSKDFKNYVADTSSVISKVIPLLIKKGLRGKIIIPNAVMAELENMANKGKEVGFIGLDQISRLHRIKQVKISFEGSRPTEMQIKYAKSGEIDALIRETAIKNQAILITADLVQAKSSQAYGLRVLYIKPKRKKRKKRFLLIFKRR
jgi:ATPase